jgi:16S rRNA processing protein RimM
LIETPRNARARAGEEALPVGRVGRPHGLDGSFYVTRPLARALTLGTTLNVRAPGAARWTSAAIVRRAGTETHPIVRLEGIDDRPAAEALRGAQLSLESGDAPALGEGEWWAHELEGCLVLDGERVLGWVLRMLELPSCEALEVGPAEGGEPLLVPMVKDAVRSIDVPAGRIEVDLDFIGLPPPRRPPRAPRGKGTSR